MMDRRGSRFDSLESRRPILVLSRAVEPRGPLSADREPYRWDSDVVVSKEDATPTYGGGRYLLAGRPDPEGRMVMDFNGAYDPPCAWTAFATCPTPRRGNRLGVAVEAGEKDWER